MKHSIVKAKFKKIDNLLIEVMNRFPHTRGDDTALYLHSLKLLGVDNFDLAEVCGLSIISVHKRRQYIQNVLGKCLPDPKIMEERQRYNEEYREIYLKRMSI